MTQTETFESWAIVELLGHVRMAGRLTEEERFGGKLGRLDIPSADEGYATIYFACGSVYRISPCSEEAARAVARRSQPEPVHQWELPRPAPLPSPVAALDEEDLIFDSMAARYND